jgi:hypothetical protein
VVTFHEVDVDEIPNVHGTGRGRVSYPICKAFLESGIYCGELDRTGMNRTLIALVTGLNQYVKTHELPIKVFQRTGKLYMMRLDINQDGSPNPDWKRADQESLVPAIRTLDEEVAELE